ncbi:MAG: prepilin-type N-terminal cleavage/methylation domain-containing protein [Chitinivibrionales bacterium]|nr:prepilin-type N-terminal cleavage/methylation domain-containing protein [Chitinivibrionales bacterium]
MKKLTQKGFTLVELMVVIVIVGILAAVAIPRFTMASHKAKASEYPTILTQIYTAELSYEAETGSYSDAWTDIGVDNPTGQSNWFSYSIPSAGVGSFDARADVAVTFGDATAGTDYAQIDENNSKTGTTDLTKYVTNWR